MIPDKYKILLWDFDGVIMDSNPVRTYGFEEVLKEYPPEQVKELVDFHKQNGGLPRYDKFRYFFEKIRGEQISNEDVNHLSTLFSDTVMKKLLDRALLMPDSFSFIKANYKRCIMHIVSGSDQAELRKVCDYLKLNKYFTSIVGSPTLKPKLVKQLLSHYGYNKREVVFIGDSINDYDAAVTNNIDFYGYNNPGVKYLSGNYIEKFK